MDDEGEYVVEAHTDFIPGQNAVTFINSTYDGVLTAELKVGKVNRPYILVRRATAGEEAVLLGEEPPPSRRGESRVRRYPSEDNPNGITPGRLKRLPRPRQIETMRAWFEAHFEEPSVSMPRDDGEFVYIRGGPYDAINLLWSEFGGVVPEHIITKLANELNQSSGEWVPINWPESEDDIEEQSSRSAAETRSSAELRQKLLTRIEEGRAEVERYGGLGHNNSPEEERLVPLSPEDRGQVLSMLDELKQQAASAAPDQARVKVLSSALRSAASRVWTEAKRKIDKGTDKLAENAIVGLAASGKLPDLYHWAMSAAVSLYHTLIAVAHAADLWLGSIHLPHSDNSGQSDLTEFVGGEPVTPALAGIISRAAPATTYEPPSTGL